jgi:dolichol-phosphate mannosyltransferase
VNDASPSLRTLLIIPIYNEEAQLDELVTKLREMFQRGDVDRILAVDDGSTDRTAQILEQHTFLTVIRHAGRRGCGASIRTGYEHALSEGFGVVVIMAGNGKDDPREVDRLIAPLRDGKADYVQGSRFLKGGISESLPAHRRVAMGLLTLVFRLFLWHRFTDCTNGFRAYRTEILRDPRFDWRQAWLGNDYELEVYMHYQVTAHGYRVIEVPVSKIYRHTPGGSYTKARLANWFTGLKPVFLLRLGLRR